MRYGPACSADLGVILLHGFPSLCVSSSCRFSSAMRECISGLLAMYVCKCRVLNDIPEKLKFTPTPQPAQCLELDKEITIQCSAKGREAPTIRWTKAGVV